MRLAADRQFLDEQQRFLLRSSCASCVYFEPDTRRCSEGYPNEEHVTVPARVGDVVCFCKSFELA